MKTKESLKRAIGWFTKMRRVDITAADRAAHEQYLLEDHQQMETYLSVERAFDNLDGLQDWADEELTRLGSKQPAALPPKARWWDTGFGAGGLAMAASVLLLVVAGIYFQLERTSTRYETSVTEQRRVVLEDGSRLNLNSASSVEVKFTFAVREIELRSGEGMFDVSTDHDRPFIVRAGKSDVIAVGTRFVVYRHDDEVTVTVLEGRVAIVPAQTSFSEVKSILVDPKQEQPGELVFVDANAQANIGKAGALQSLIRVNAVDVSAWSEGKLIFRDTPLRQVVQEMSRYIPEQVRVGNDVPDYPVTGIIQIREAASMIDLLSQVTPVIAVKESEHSIVLHKRS